MDLLRLLCLLWMEISISAGRTRDRSIDPTDREFRFFSPQFKDVFFFLPPCTKSHQNFLFFKQFSHLLSILHEKAKETAIHKFYCFFRYTDRESGTYLLLFVILLLLLLAVYSRTKKPNVVAALSSALYCCCCTAVLMYVLCIRYFFQPKV